jgi:hypothetical protein
MLSDVLPSAPSTVRTFKASDTLALFAEIYDNNPTLKTSTAYDLTLNADLRSETGNAVRSASAARPAQEPLRASGGHGFTVRLPLSNVAAGTYILHIEGRSTHDATPIVTRDLPIRVD